MCGKYNLTKFAIFLIIVLRAEFVTTFGSEMVTISARNTIIINLRTSQGYIFRILQHFATKFWNFTTFERLFSRISFFLYGFASIKN